MPATCTPLTGDALLAGVTAAMIRLHEHYHHRQPVTAKTTLLGGDLLVCVLGGVYTDVEKTMIELERSTMVQETRSAFQNAMQHKFIAAVEHLSGRGVLAFISNHHVGPDVEIELFLLKPEPHVKMETVAGVNIEPAIVARDLKARTWLETDQTAAALDQTQADFDQAESDADQQASHVDQGLADQDQDASDRDQVLANWEHDQSPVAALTEQAYQTSRMQRHAASRERGSTAAVRSRNSEERQATAARRDDVARARDRTAAARDRTAQSRDDAADARDAAADLRDAAADARDSVDEARHGRTIAEAATVRDATAPRRTLKLAGARTPSVSDSDRAG
jgi:uncharacterized protein YbcI